MTRAKIAGDTAVQPNPARINESKPPQSAEVEREGATPEDRAAWFYKTRSDKHGKVLSGLWARAAKHRRRLETETASHTAGQPGPAGSVNWTPIGPSVVISGIQESGRITSIVVGPGGNRVYAGAANGGVWFSANGGSDWSPLDDYTTSPSVFAGSGTLILLRSALLPSGSAPGQMKFCRHWRVQSCI